MKFRIMLRIHSSRVLTALILIAVSILIVDAGVVSSIRLDRLQTYQDSGTIEQVYGSLFKPTAICFLKGKSKHLQAFREDGSVSMSRTFTGGETIAFSQNGRFAVISCIDIENDEEHISTAYELPGWRKLWVRRGPLSNVMASNNGIIVFASLSGLKPFVLDFYHASKGLIRHIGPRPRVRR